MPASTPYQILGIAEGARSEDVRRAHRRLVRRYHPDRNPGDPMAAEAFIAVQAAYETLIDDINAGLDSERIAANAEKAAAEARRRREGPMDGAESWSIVAVELHRTAAERTTDALSQPVGWAGVTTAIGLAAASVWVLPIPIALGLAIVGFLVAVRAADTPPDVVETHWDGLRDLRWNAKIKWDDVAAIREGKRALELTLAPAAAKRLRARLPEGAISGGDVYRLPLAEPAHLTKLMLPHLAPGVAGPPQKV